MYAVWYPNGYANQPAIAQEGATIGGWFTLRIVVQPQSGTIISGTGEVSATLQEQTNSHTVTPLYPQFEQSSTRYPGDPEENAIILESLQNLSDKHNGQYQVEGTVRYTVSTGNPPPNDRQTFTEPFSFVFNVSNLVLIDSRSEPYFVWKPLEVAPPPQPAVGLNGLDPEPIPTGVAFSAQLVHAQSGTCTVKLEIFRSDDHQTPVLEKEFENVARPSTWSWTWDGKLGDGSTAPCGIYLYRLSAYVYGSAPPDRNSNRSDYLHIERAYDENNEPILEAEYWGYDDHGTPDDDTDDEHLYFIRWYVLKDSLDTNASSGTIWLYDPELNPVYSWDITALRCVEHNEATDGLRASAGGIKHGVIVPVPVSVMQAGGKYRFLSQVKDDHVAYEKAHRLKPALELNSETMPQVLYLWVSGTSPDYTTQIHWWYILWLRYVTRLHPIRSPGYMGVTTGTRGTIMLSSWPVEYNELSIAQVQYQRFFAKQNVWADSRTLIVTGCKQSGASSQLDAVAKIQQRDYRNTPPTDPCITAIGELWIDQLGLQTVEEENWVRTNALLHEISHFLGDNLPGHCTVPSCVRYHQYTPSFNAMLRNRVRIRGEWYDLPWHTLDEVNKMRRGLGWPNLPP